MTLQFFEDRLALLFWDRIPKPPAAQRERLAIYVVAGTAEVEARASAETHLMFARELAQTGRIGEGHDGR